MQDIFPHFPGNIFRSETLHLLLRIILESFKLHYFFLASNTCDGYFAAQTRIRSGASSCYTVANLNAREFWCAVSGFGQCLIVSGVTTFTKFKCLAAKNSCLNPLWTYFLVTCPRLDPNDGITARGCAWISPKRQLSFFTIGCWLFIYRCSEDLNKQFSQSRNRFLRQILNVRSLQIILNEKSLVIKWFSLKIGYKRN